MANRTASFTFAAGTPTGNQTPTQNLFLTVKDAAGVIVWGPNVTAPTSAVLSLPVANGYTATLAARDAAGVYCASPPAVTFDVPPPPPPPAPPNPTLNPPTIS